MPPGCTLPAMAPRNLPQRLTPAARFEARRLDRNIARMQAPVAALGSFARTSRPANGRSARRTVSGQLPIDASGNKLVDAAFEVQAHQVLANVAGALEAAGSSVSCLVQVRVYVTDIARWPALDAIYAAWAGASRPARAVVPVPTLHCGLRIEIEAVAMVEPREPHPRATRSTRTASSPTTRGAP